jgi:arsenate reductase (thioredoxin)
VDSERPLVDGRVWLSEYTSDAVGSLQPHARDRNSRAFEAVAPSLTEAAIRAVSHEPLLNVCYGALMERVIFACVHNAGRSQMAAAFLSQMADATRVQATSAGTQPSERVHPGVVDVMREVGIDLTDRRPQLLTEELARGASLLITMGCGDECPYIPGVQRDDWPLRDPQNLPVSDIRAIRDDIRDRVAALVASRGW